MESFYIQNNKPIVIIFGDIMLDHNIEGNCNKIANEGPIPVVHVNKERFSIGGCGNVLHNVLALGATKVFLFSRIGTDNNGNKLKSLIPVNTVNCIIEDEMFTTITKTRIYSDKKIMARYDSENIIQLMEDQEMSIVDRFKCILASENISSVIFSDYNKGFLTKSLCQKVINICNENKIPSIVDPKVDYTKYIGCTVIKPNITETKNIFKLDLNVISFEECHRSIEAMVKCDSSIITLSGDGISAYKNDTHYRVSEDTKDVIDVTGAGDVVCAVLGTYYSFINDIQTLITIANHLASISVGHLGVYTITSSDLYNTYRYIHGSKVIDINMFTKLNLKTVIFTNGCFDILHSAHIELFKFCKSLGGKVVVGLNTDDSIKRLKGTSRPIFKLDDRIKMLNAIEYIDFIIPFSDDTPFSLIREIKPAILVKGGDYTEDNIIGREYAKKIVIFNYIDGLSTSIIINNIKSRI